MKGFISKIKGIFNKGTVLKSEPDKIDLAISEIPDWLYKKSMTKPEDFESNLNIYVVELKEICQEFKFAVSTFKNTVISEDKISAYKKDFVEEKKKLYTNKLEIIIGKIEQLNIEKKSKDDKNSLEEKRKIIEQLKDEIFSTNEKKAQFERTLLEYYSKELTAVDAAFFKISAKVDLFKDLFKTDNDERVELILNSIDKLKEMISQKKGILLEVDKCDGEIKTVKEHIVKLESKIWTLKNTARFKDILSEREGLGELIESKNKKTEAILAKLDPLFAKMPTSSKAKEYQEFFASALINDSDLEIIPEVSAIADDSDEKKWMLENFKTARDEVIDLTNRINSAMAALKKHVVVNEIDDIEERELYYQQKLKELQIARKQKLDSINVLNIDSRKNTVYKDIMVLTGYDVHMLDDI